MRTALPPQAPPSPTRSAGRSAFVRGVGASFASGSLTLPGSGALNGNEPPATVAGYIDLPNGIVSSKTHLTVEIWATPITHQNFQRLIDFGRVNVTATAVVKSPACGTYDPATASASDGLTLTLSRAILNEQRFEGKLNGVATQDGTGLYRLADTGLATTANTQYHYVMTFEDGVGQLRCGWRALVLVSERRPGRQLGPRLPPQPDRGREQLARPLAVDQRQERQRRFQ